MKSLVMVAVDPESKDSEALSWATEWSLVTGQELLLVSAFNAGQAELAPQFHDELLDDAHRDVENRLRDLGPQGKVRHWSRIIDGEPSGVIVSTAEERDPSLVVLGARGSGGFEGLGLGGVAHHVAHHLHRPMVVVPHLGGRIPGGTIVVGVDGSKSGRDALRWAFESAKESASRVLAVFVTDPMADSYPHEEAANWTYRGELEMRDEIASLDPGDVESEVSRVSGHPVSALRKVAEEVDAAMIVVGNRGAGGFHGLILGRVPAQLLHHAGRPVALIHHHE